MKQRLTEVVARLREFLAPLRKARARLLAWPPLQFLREQWMAFAERRPRLAAFAKWSSLLGFLLLLFLLVFYSLLLSGRFGPLPSYAELRHLHTEQASEVYSADGQLLGRFYRKQRVNASLEEIPKTLRDALIATEDARFLEHRGIDYKAMLRVLFKTLLLQKKEAGGGSTLSQQLAKNLYPRRSFRLLSLPINKSREMIIAHRLESIYSKEELLRMYLNTVPFGENIYGIKLASQRFFGKEPADLKTEEAAVLIGMLKANTTYNPVLYPERALERRNVVLAQMSKYGYLEEGVKDSLRQLPLEISYTEDRVGLAGHFREEVRRQAEGILESIYTTDGRPYDLKTDGLRIYTTLDSRLQAYAEQAVRKQLPVLQKRFDRQWKPSKQLLASAMRRSERYQKMKRAGKTDKEIGAAFRQKRPMQIYDPIRGTLREVEMSPRDSLIRYLGILHTGFIALQPETGAVLAYVGDADYRYFQYDYVQANRQVGSVFKPIVYLAGMQAGMNPCDYIQAERKTYEQYDGWTPENADHQYGQWYSFRGALMQSVNTISVEVCMQAGVERVVKLAYDMGIVSELPEGPALALGAADLKLSEMAVVYGTLANRGRQPEPYYIERIENAEGELLYEYRRPEREELFIAMVPEDAALITDLLRAVIDGGTGASLRSTYGIRGDWAGKTGTSQNQADGWFMAYSPALVVGVWVGANSPRVHWPSLYSGQGARTALPIAGRFLQAYQRDKRYRKWRTRRFPALTEEQRAFLDCPPTLDSLEYEEIYHGGDFTEWIKRVTNPEQRKKSREQREEKRAERKERRKEFFRGLFRKGGGG